MAPWPPSPAVSSARSTCARTSAGMATSRRTCGTQASCVPTIREEFAMHDDLYANVTARIVAALERGVAPWVRPWSTAPDALPMNAQTRRPYRGVNFTLLSLEATAHGYPLNRWVTYRQALELGGQVRRRERGTTVAFWKLRKIGATVDAYPDHGEADLHERVIPLLRAYTVFNVAQVDGLPTELSAVPPPAWEPEARAEELLLMSGAKIRHGGALAY